MIAIVDYGIGNLGSIHNMLLRLGVASTITSRVEDLTRAEKIILPGVGACNIGMQNLVSRGLVPILNDLVLVRGIPVLGICLGMQLMTRQSEEGSHPCLGWLAAETKKFHFDPTGEYRLPHMGWSQLRICRGDSILHGLDEHQRFYFVHSYYVVCDRPEDVLATSRYGIEFCAVVGHGHIVGTQFHPEKSHRYGMTVLSNFARG